MPLTVRELVTETSLHLSVVVEGDLDAPLGWVHVSELADPTPYLEGGELILTAGIWRGRDTRADAFVGALTQRSVVAVGWGLLHEETEVPADVVAACRAAGVSLLAVPVRTPFIAISRWFTERLAEARESDLRARLEFSRALLAAADDVGGGPGESAMRALRRITRLVAAELGSPVAVEADGVVLALSEDSPGLADRTASWPAFPVGGAVLRIARPSVAGDELRNRLSTALPVVGLVLARRRAVRETERRLAAEAVALVMSGQDEAARLRLTSYGLIEAATTVVVVLQLGHGAASGAEAAARAVEDELAARGLRGVVGQRGEQLDVLLQVAVLLDDEATAALARALLQAADGLAAGVSRPVAGLRELRQAVQAGRETLALAVWGAPGSVVLQQRGASHHTLLALHEAEVVTRFGVSVLGAVVDYDRIHGSVLVATLRRFLELDGSWKRCAEDLGLHVNTLRQRIARIETITGRSLERTADRVDLWLALQSPVVRAAAPPTDYN